MSDDPSIASLLATETQTSLELSCVRYGPSLRSTPQTQAWSTEARAGRVLRAPPPPAARATPRRRPPSAPPPPRPSRAAGPLPPRPRRVSCRLLAMREREVGCQVDGGRTGRCTGAQQGRHGLGRGWGGGRAGAAACMHMHMRHPHMAMPSVQRRCLGAVLGAVLKGGGAAREALARWHPLHAAAHPMQA